MKGGAIMGFLIIEKDMLNDLVKKLEQFIKEEEVHELLLTDEETELMAKVETICSCDNDIPEELKQAHEVIEKSMLKMLNHIEKVFEELKPNKKKTGANEFLKFIMGLI